MKSMILAVFVLIAVIFGGLYFFPFGKTSNFPGSSQKSGFKLSPTSGSINIPKNCNGQITPNMTDGPYYKENSPERTVLREAGISGGKFILTGYVFDTNCKPVAQAWVDFWQANGSGEYDNSGFKLRGHQFTDSEGKYYLETVVPGQYTGRTPHIHVKVQGNKISPIVTTQLYFPDNSRNSNDPIFDSATLINVENTKIGKVGTYNFVVDAK